MIFAFGMKLSFVIPAHNEEHYLGRCLESIAKARAGKKYDIEVIVVDNASTDATAQVAECFKDVRVVREPRKGLAQARQSGFAAATGDLIANVDADTMLPPGWVETVFTDFTDNSNLVALSGPPIFYDVPERVNSWVKVFNAAGLFTHWLNSRVFHVSAVLQGGNFVVRRSALEKIGGFNPEFSFYGEDADIAKRLHKIGEVRYTSKLPMYMSGRRVMAEGKFTIAYRYALNYLWTNMFGRPFTTKSKVIRHK